MIDENIDKTDVFIALTNDDEVNIMASLLAKRLGTKKVMTLITNPVYANLMQGGEIDVAISPQLATTSSVLAHVRKGDTGVVHSHGEVRLKPWNLLSMVTLTTQKLLVEK